MKIIIYTMGTRGDVQPYLFLAQELKEKGHQVFLGTHPCWRKLVEEENIDFVAIGPDISIEYEAAVIRGKAKNPMISMLKTMSFVFKIIENSSEEIYESAKGKDLIIVSHSRMGATEAEALKIPMIQVILQTEMIPQVNKEKNFKDKLFGALVNPQIVKPYNKIRKKYNLPKIKEMQMNGMITLIPISKYVQEFNPYWEEKNKITGYWYKEDLNYIPPAELDEFLKSEDKPLVLALGAMSFESDNEKEKLDMFVQAFNETGHRAVIQGFNKTMENYVLPKNMIHVGSIPHSYLFSHAYAVIHHCGFGTSAATMIYGVPSIPVPHVLDQMAFADKLEKLGVSTKTLKASELSEASIKERIKDLDSNYDKYSGQVQRLSENIKKEEGLGLAVQLIEQAAIEMEKNDKKL